MCSVDRRRQISRSEWTVITVVTKMYEWPYIRRHDGMKEAVAQTKYLKLIFSNQDLSHFSVFHQKH